MTPLRALARRFVALARPARQERELDAEIAAHLAEATQDYVERGLSPADARLAALRDFGGVTQVREIHREMRSIAWVDELRQDVRYTFRQLLARPAFTSIAVATLALGIGANTAVFGLLDAVMFKPLPVHAPGELVALYERGPEGPPDTNGGTGRFLRFSYPRFERLREALGADGSIAAVTRSSILAVQLQGVVQAQFVSGQLVSDGYFETLGVTAASGRTLNANDHRPERESAVAVVSDGFWKHALGAPANAIGTTIRVNGVETTIVGVMPPGFAGTWTDNEASLWLPAGMQRALRYQNNSSSYGRVDNTRSWTTQDTVAWLNVVARIPEDRRPRVMQKLHAANLRALGELAAQVATGEERDSMLGHTLAAEPLVHGFSGLRTRYSDALFVLMTLVAFVLLVGCANLANLLLARGAAQARETSVRLSLGASTRRLVQHRLIESLVLAIAGGGAGVLIATWVTGALARQVIGRAGQPLPSVFAPDLRIVMFATIVSVITAVVFGLAPALRAIAIARKVSLLSNQRVAVGQAQAGGMRPLIVAQLALSLVIVLAAASLGRTLAGYLRIDPGFEADRLVTASFDPISSKYNAAQMATLSQRLIDAVRGLPSVRSAATSMCGLLGGCSSTSSYAVEGTAGDVSLRQNWVSAGYFATTGIRLASGREFGERDGQGSAPVAVVNASFARRYFADRNPVGRRIGHKASAPQATALDIEIVGVVEDARTQSLHDAPEPMAYLPIGQWGGNLRAGVTTIDVRTDGDPRLLVGAVRGAIAQAAPNLFVYDVTTMRSRLSRDLTRERLVAYLAFCFAALTLLLAALGLYAVLSYGVTQRTQEIGVRMALGARRVEVLRAILAQSARLTAAGIGAGALVAAVAARYVSRRGFDLAPIDAVTLAGVLAVFIAVTMLASYLPARRATRVDPMLALRAE